ncbi:MAG: hypothetical protein ACK41D_02470 [Rubricoccaceae bacterium]
MKRTPILLAAAAVLGLAAFGFARPVNPGLDATISALQGGLTNIPAQAALENIDGWRAALAGRQEPALRRIHRDLGTLRAELQRTPINGARVGMLMAELGSATTVAAASVQGEDAAKLARLGGLLGQNGRRLMGMPEAPPATAMQPSGMQPSGMQPSGMQPSGDAALLQGTVAAAEGGLTRLPAAAAVQNIEAWQARLRGSDNPTLVQIHDDLGRLRTELQRTTLDGQAIGRLLTSLGQNTTAAAASADAASRPQLTRLGSLLSAAGGQLAGR